MSNANPRFAAVADEQDGACKTRGERPEEQRRQDGGAEGGAEQQRELHVAHPEPGRVRQAEHEQARERAGHGLSRPVARRHQVQDRFAAEGRRQRVAQLPDQVGDPGLEQAAIV